MFWRVCSYLTALGVVALISSHFALGTVSRNLLQDEAVVVNGRKSGERAFEKLKAGQVVELKFESVNLTKTWVVEKEGVTVKGGLGGGKQPVVVCPKDEPALVIRASGVKVEDVIFKDCNGKSPVVVVEPEETDISGDDVVLVFSVLFLRVKFENNTVDDDLLGRGGSLVVGQASVSIEDSDFNDNIVQNGPGAAIGVRRGAISIKDSRFRNNTADTAGGAIVVGMQGSFDSEEDQQIDGIIGLKISNCVFEGNKALASYGGVLFQKSNGAPLEGLTYIDFYEHLVGRGGALKVESFSDVSIENSEFIENEAPNGGAVYLEYIPGLTVPLGAKGFEVTNCKFKNNAATIPSALEVNTGLHSGGALFVHVAEEGLKFSCTGTRFDGNHAMYGGGLHVIAAEQARVRIESCNFVRNTATRGGGGALFRNVDGVVWRGSNVTECRAEIGGGVLLTNRAGMQMSGPDLKRTNAIDNSVFEGNLALDGAGLMCALCGASTLPGPWFHNNTASRHGGGIGVVDAISDMVIQDGQFSGNLARRGGGAYVDTDGFFRLFATSNQRVGARMKFSRNRAVSGGGLFVVPRSNRQNLIKIDETLFEKNAAIDFNKLKSELESAENVVMEANSRGLLQANASDVLGDDGATVRNFADCGSGGGGGMCVVLDRAPDESGVAVDFGNIDFVGNEANIGGGAYVLVSDLEWVGDRCPQGRTTTTTARPCRSFHLDVASFVENSALFAGGGLFISNPKTLVLERKEGEDGDVALGSKFVALDDAWKENMAAKFSLSFDNNSVEDPAGFGKDVASKAFSLELFPVGDLRGQSSGQKITPMKLRVVDAFNQTVSAGLPDAEVDVTLKSQGATGQLLYKAEKGLVYIDNTRAIGEHVEHAILFSARGVRSTMQNFIIRECFPGEAEEGNFLECIVCGETTYSFLPKEGCARCEEHAECPGGASLIPKPGYWHSTPYSPYFHECIIREACEYKNRSSVLEEFYSDLSQLVPNNTIQPNSVYMQCAKGYEDVLCGSCADSYGHVAGGECQECISKGGALGLLVLGFVWTFLVLVFEVYQNTRASMEYLRSLPSSSGVVNVTSSPPGAGPDMEMHDTHQQQEITVGPHEGADVGEQSEESAAGPQGEANVEEQQEEPIPTNSQLDSSLASRSETFVETMKIAINYLQVTGQALSISLPWKAIDGFLKFLEFLGGLSGASFWFPLECVGGAKGSASWPILGLWYRILYPVLVYLLLIGLVAVTTRAQMPRHVAKSVGKVGELKLSRNQFWIVAFITFAFFSYNDLTEAALRSLNCLQLHENGMSINHNFTSLPHSWIWAEDTRLGCWEGIHYWALVPGILILMFYSAGFLLFILQMIYLQQQEKDEEKKREYMTKFGFLYGSYRQDCWWTQYWELVVMLRKVAISLFVVFAYRLGPGLQAALAAGVLIFAYWLHIAGSPYKESVNSNHAGENWMKKIVDGEISLNRMEALSIFMTLLIFHAGIVLNDENSSELGKNLTISLVLIPNFLYFLFMVVKISCFLWWWRKRQAA